LGQANSAQPWAKADPALWAPIFGFSISLHFQKIVYISKMRRKYNTTQKNMKQISIESLRVNLGFRLDKSYPYTLLPSVKFLQLEP
jgi:hypothetical protein